MRRDPGLAELSRDHHQALYQAMRMKRATEDDLGDVLFPMIEMTLERAALEGLGRRIAEAESSPRRP